MTDNPYPDGSGMKLNMGRNTMHYELHTAWDEGYAEGFAAARAADRNTEGVWPDQSAMHGVLLDQIKDAYAEGIADTIDRLRVRAAEMLPEVARFTLDEIEVAAAELLASSTAEKLAAPRKRSASGDPMPLCDCELCARPLRDHDEEETR